MNKKENIHLSEIDYKPFAQLFKAARKLKGKEITQEYMANILGLNSGQYYARLENGSSAPSWPVFVKLVRFFNVDVADLLLPGKKTSKSVRRLEVERVLDELNDEGMIVLAILANGLAARDEYRATKSKKRANEVED